MVLATVFRNKKTGQISLMIPKKQLSLTEKDKLKKKQVNLKIKGFFK